MTKRQLTRTEREMVSKGLERSKQKIRKVKENLTYNKALIRKQKYLREFDDKWRDYLRKQKDEEDQKIIKLIEEEIYKEETGMKIDENQLNEGVEEKKPPIGIG